MKSFFGYVREQDARRWPDAPGWLPGFSFRETHQSVPLAAPPAAILQAVLEINMEDDPLIGTLLKLRELPGKLRQFCGNTRTARQLPPFGLHTFTLLHHDNQRLEFGLAGKFWGGSLDMQPLATADDFLQFNDPQAAKLVLRFQVIPAPAGGHRLKTDTFVWCPTPGVKARFACYWGVIRPASGLIRRRTLYLVRQHLAAA